MFALPSIILTILAVYLRPQELIPQLAAFPLLYVLLALTILGVLIDFRLRLSRPQATPLLVWALAYVAWCMFTMLITTPDKLIELLVDATVPLVLFLTIAHGVQTFRALETLCVVVLGLSLFLAYVGVDQKLSGKTCHQVAPGEKSGGINDFRPCEKPYTCRLDSAEPNVDYVCEYAGILGTHSYGGRVRWTGILEDPNYTALAVSCGLAFLFALRERKRRSVWRRLLLFGGLLLGGACLVFTQSRGGQLVLLTVLGVYFVNRAGLAKGALVGVLLAIPVMALGGREGDEAEGSSKERLECWNVGCDMFKESPVWGVGSRNFTEYHFLTAHNSWVLVGAETGLVGLVIWNTMIYLGLKTAWLVLVRARRQQRAAAAAGRAMGEGGPSGRGPPAVEIAPVAQTYALAILSAMAGMCVGIFFLSFANHAVLWVFFGLAGALYSCVRTHDPTFEVPISGTELILIAVANFGLMIFLLFYTRLAM